MKHAFLIFLIASAIVRSALAFAQRPEKLSPSDRIVFTGNETDRCLKCHGMQNLAYLLPEKDQMKLRSFTVMPDTFRNSIHGTVACNQCHTEITQFPHEFREDRKHVSCDRECHAVDTEGRPYTHTAVVAEFRTSVHGKSLTDPNSAAARCESCHGGGNVHAIRKAKGSLDKQQRMTLCIACHDNETLIRANRVPADAVQTYRRSFHYKAIRFGRTETAVCQDCHTVHHVLPPDSSASSINQAHLPATCGQNACHPGVNMNFAMSGANHLGLRVEKEVILFLVEKFFVVLTVGTLIMLAAGIILDIQRKYGWIVLVHRAALRAVSHARSGRILMQRASVAARRLLID
jgi:hypothetical protein